MTFKEVLTACLPFLLALQSNNKPQGLTSSFRSVYDDLALPGHDSHSFGPTIRFDKVSHASSSSSSDEGDDSKPIALYLPGLDGYGISAATFQFDDLARTFDFWRLFIDPSDRSSFRQVSNSISDFVVQLHTNTSRPITLIGESCGGLFAAATAIRLRQENILQGLVMVNPATSFDQSSWDVIAPQLAMLDEFTSGGKLDPDDSKLPSPYSVAGSLLLSATIPDNEQYQRILGSILSSSGTPADFLETSLVAFKQTEARLPAKLLQHRIQWLIVGAPIVNARLAQLTVPTFVVVGKQDRLLPSDSEANRLIKLIPKAEKLVVRQRGHLVLDESVNLTEAILYSAIDPLAWTNRKKKYDPITDWKLPDQSIIDSVTVSRVKPLVTAHSPVWFSTDENGKRWKGLQKIPTNNHNGDGPILVVGNHQLAGLDLGLILTELWKQRGMWPRGLAHPVTFFGSQGFPGELYGRQPGIQQGSTGDADFRASFQQFGAVQVTPRNYYRLLQTGQNAMLFPGGAKEAQTGRKDYPLFWPEKVDFVRTAAKFNATILPLSAIGMVDSVKVLAEPKQLVQIPFVGTQLRSLSANISSARYDEKNEDEVIGFPVVVPILPARNYFVFGQPICLKDINPNDKEACLKVYHEVQGEVRRGLDDLLRAREADSYKEPSRRLLYERLYQKPAPTFPVAHLNA